MRYCHLGTWGLLLLAAGACKQAGKSNGLSPRTARPNDALFPIVVRGRWGFIDSTGAMVIAPRFAEVQYFSEGLAPVREAGNYGFVTKAGQFVLPQAYAYATGFQGGLAVINQDSTPRLIDRSGKLVPLPATYKRLDWQPGSNGGFWIGTLPSYKQHLLTSHGQLLSPTRFARIGACNANRLVVVATEPSTAKDSPPEIELTGVLDKHGKLVIPYRRFDQISPFRDGLATATLYQPVYDEKTRQECVIDTTGRVVAYLPKGRYSLGDDGFSDGVMQASRISRDTARDGGIGINDYPVALDPTGKLLFNNPRLRVLGKYGHHCAWASGQDNEWYLLNKAGRQLNKVTVRAVLALGSFGEAPSFADGVELVALAADQGYATLDTTGRVVRRLPGARSGNRDAERRGNILAFYADSTLRMGFWNWRTGLLIEPRFSAIDPAGYQHGLLAVIEDRRLGYLSAAGRYVWREAPATSAPLNLDHLRRSTYYVASPPLRRYASMGGWGSSGNLPHPAQPPLRPGPALRVAVAAQATADGLAPGISGHRVEVANPTADTVVFDAQDSRLYMAVQAQDTRGRWRDIEHIPSSFCGNSYHQVFLAPGQYWQLTVPAYTGEQPTRLRVRLTQRRTRTARQPTITVYSNSFAGSVNPAQFWRQQQYSPQGIMDPYLN